MPIGQAEPVFAPTPRDGWLPTRLHAVLERVTGWSGGPIPHAGAAPGHGGAYILAIRLAEPVLIKLGNSAATILPPAQYLYCGSACGAGGIRGRLGRHFRKGKTVRWHIDRLTRLDSTSLLAWSAQRSECELVETLLLAGRFTVPVPGFGSSDCRRCESHLLKFGDCRE